jgi:NADH-quinone oxidoreductase subunit A
LSPTPDLGLWPLAVYTAIVILLVMFMLGFSYILGERHKERATVEPYESGVVPVGTAKLRMDVQFYLIAVFFVIFDVEAVFIFAWAVAVRELGWAGYAELVVFITFLLAGLIYLWRLGALDAATLRQKADKITVLRGVRP